MWQRSKSCDKKIKVIMTIVMILLSTGVIVSIQNTSIIKYGKQKNTVLEIGEAKKIQVVKAKKIIENVDMKAQIVRNIFISGEYEVGKNIEKGRYLVKPIDGSEGSIIIKSKNNEIVLDEPIGGKRSKMVVAIDNGYIIDLRKIDQVEFVTSKSIIMSTGNLPSGVYLIGKDIQKGKYEVNSLGGLGVINIYDSQGVLSKRYIINESEKISINFKNNEVVEIKKVTAANFLKK